MKFGGDDQYICEKLRSEYGENVLVIDPRLAMPHEFSRKFVDSLRRSYLYGKASGRHGRQIRNIPSINPGPIIACFLVGAGLAFRQILTPRISIMLCTLVLFFLEMFTYNILLVKQKIIVTKSISKKFLFGLAFFFCELLNCYGFITGFIRGNETLVNRYE
jgi:hypothetical protein